MKKIRIVLALLVGFLAYNVNGQDLKKVSAKEAPVITFTKTLHDFGTINEGDVVETTFEFTNTGNAPLTILRIKASCGCTIPSNWEKAPIQVGEKSSFTVKFNSKNKPNRQNKRITIVSNTAKGTQFVTIKANVIPDPELQKVRDERAAKRKADRELKKQMLKKDESVKVNPSINSRIAPRTPKATKDSDLKSLQDSDTKK